MTDLTSLTIAQASARLATRDIHTVQLVNAYLTRIAKLNPDLDAFRQRDPRSRPPREARPRPGPSARGTRHEAPLYGIPIAHKDLFETRGVRTTAGSMLFENYIPKENAAIVQLEDAGAVLNTHKLRGGATTINPFFGTTRDPWTATALQGGSSGGSAAAVAARLCLAAQQAATPAGSVPHPRRVCGCVGFEPTVRPPSAAQSLIAASPSFDHVGFLTRTVETARSYFPATSGALPGQAVSPRRVVAAWEVARGYFFEALDPAVADAVERAIEGIKCAWRHDLGRRASRSRRKRCRRFSTRILLFELWGRFGAELAHQSGSFSKQFSDVFSIERPTVPRYETALAALEGFSGRSG